MSAVALLTVTKNGQTVRSQSIEGEVLIGRSEQCGLRLDDRAVSREHAVLRTIEGGVQIERKSEFSPLSVNGVECTKAIVKEGDVIEIGPYRMRLGKPASPSPVGAAASAVAPASAPAPHLAPVIPITGSVAAPVEVGEPPASVFAPVAAENQFEPSVAIPFQAEANLADSPAFAPQPVPVIQDNGLLQSFDQNHLSPISTPLVQDLGMQSLEVLEGTSTRVVSQIVDAKISFAPGLTNVEELVITKAETSIGRGSECDVILLQDTKASRKHALILKSSARFVLKDLGSANGSFVNGARVTDAELSDGDRVQVGDTQFSFTAVSPDYVAKQSALPAVQPQEELTPEPHVHAPASVPPDEFAPEGTRGIEPEQSFALGRPGAPTQRNAFSPLEAPKPLTIFEKFRALPPKRQAIWAVIVAALFYFLVIEEEEPMRRATAPKPQVTNAAGKAVATYESLSPDKKRFVEAQHRIAFGFYKNKEYDKALFELEKIFALIADYKDAREIERYAQEGKRRLEALEEERKKRQDDEKNRAKISELMDRAGEAMIAKKYPQAKDAFSQVLAIDPENLPAKNGQKEIEEIESKKEQDRKASEVRKAVNRAALGQFEEAMSIYRSGEFLRAIPAFKEAAEMDASDASIKQRSLKMIAQVEERMHRLIEPLISRGKAEESAGEYTKAYRDYQAASKIDPRRTEPFDGMERIRGVLTDRAKVIYTEGVIAESYSDFAVAKKKFEEVKVMTPDDSLYHERAVRKLDRYKPAGEKIQ